MPDVSNLRDTIAPKSDQLNADDLLGGQRIITVTKVSRCDGDQPVAINFEGDNGKTYKPCKSMRKILVFAWGDDGREWVGRRMAIFNDPEVKFGGVKVGGIRISRLSHIQADIAISLNTTKGKKSPFIIKKLPEEQRPQAPANQNADVPPDQAAVDAAKAALTEAAKLGTPELVKKWKSLGGALRGIIGPDGCPENLKAAAKAADEAAAQQPAE